jgi:hypothetical protein
MENRSQFMVNRGQFMENRGRFIAIRWRKHGWRLSVPPLLVLDGLTPSRDRWLALSQQPLAFDTSTLAWHPYPLAIA